MRAENARSKNYALIVNSNWVKDQIMKHFNIKEEEYYRLLAIFNERNSDIIYELESQDLIQVLNMFYQEELNKKN